MDITRRSALGFGIAAALIGVAGCGSSGEETTGDAPTAETSESNPAAEPQSSPAESMDNGAMDEGMQDDKKGSDGEAVITVEGFKFRGPESVSPGATITIVNKDVAPHTVTSEEEGVFDVEFAGGETVTFTAPEEPGEYPYICTLHPAMTATLVVE